MPYSTQFIGGEPTASSFLPYVVPTGYTAVVRDLEGRNLGPDADTLILRIIVPGPLNVTAAQLYQIGDDESGQWTGRVVVNAGETIEVVPATNTWQVFVSGYLLSAP